MRKAIAHESRSCPTFAKCERPVFILQRQHISPHRDTLQRQAVKHILFHALHCATCQHLRHSPDAQTIAFARHELSVRLSEPVDMHALATKLHLSYSHIRRLFRQQTGRIPQQYLLDLRLSQARELLERGEYSVKEVAARTGFRSAYYFSRLFKQRIGIPPSQWRGLTGHKKKYTSLAFRGTSKRRKNEAGTERMSSNIVGEDA